MTSARVTRAASSCRSCSTSARRNKRLSQPRRARQRPTPIASSSSTDRCAPQLAETSVPLTGSPRSSGGRRSPARRGQMLRSATTAMALTALSLAALPARADVLEIGEAGQARWVAGPAAQAESAPADMSADIAPAAEHLASRADLTARLIPGAYAAKVHELAERFDLSPALSEALVWQESRWRERAVSPAGARGLAQLMPGTARELGVNPDDPFANLEGGARYLRQQLDRFDGDVEKAL